MPSRERRSQAFKELDLAIERLDEKLRILKVGRDRANVEIETYATAKADLERQRDNLFEQRKKPSE